MLNADFRDEMCIYLRSLLLLVQFFHVDCSRHNNLQVFALAGNFAEEILELHLVVLKQRICLVEAEKEFPILLAQICETCVLLSFLHVEFEIEEINQSLHALLL